MRWLLAILVATAGLPAQAGQDPSGAPLDCLGLDPCTSVQTGVVIREPGDTACTLANAPEDGPQVEKADPMQQVLEQVHAIPESERKFILGKLDKARGFAIFPDVRKTGVMAASVHGQGIILYRDANGRWSPPVLLTLQGRSLGPQVCAQCSRIVFIFDSTEGVRDFLTGHHHFMTTTTGTSIRHIDHPEPDEPLKMTIYTMHNGMAVGQSLDNYAIHLDEEVNTSLHGIEIKPGCLAEGLRIGPRRPWFQQVYERMLLPPGQPHDTTLIQ